LMLERGRGGSGGGGRVHAVAGGVRKGSGRCRLQRGARGRRAVVGGQGAARRGQAVARCGGAYAVGRPWSVVGCRSIWYRGIVDRLLTTRYYLLATALRPEGVRPWFAAAGARSPEGGRRRTEDGGRPDGVRP
jgi:hypothetical protein